MTTDKKEIRLTVGRAIVVLIFLISGTASSVTTCTILTQKVERHTEDIAALQEKDSRHIELINNRIQKENDIMIVLERLETAVGYIKESVDDLK